MNANKFLHKKDVAYMNRLSTSLDFDRIVSLMEEYAALRIHDVVSSCVDKDELISDLDDRRAVGVEMNEDMWYFCRKQSAEYLLEKYKLLRK